MPALSNRNISVADSIFRKHQPPSLNIPRAERSGPAALSLLKAESHQRVCL
jgi:hypothetical protein